MKSQSVVRLKDIDLNICTPHDLDFQLVQALSQCHCTLTPPVLLRSSGQFIIQTGHKVLLAALAAGLKKINVFIMESQAELDKFVPQIQAIQAPTTTKKWEPLDFNTADRLACK